MLNWRALPVRLAATLAAGLPEDSRCKMYLTDRHIPDSIQLQAVMADELRWIEWRFFAQPGSRRPPSIRAALLGEQADTPDSNVQSYASPADFEAALATIRKGG